MTWYVSTEGGIGQLLTIQQVEQVAYSKIVQFKLLLSMTEFQLFGQRQLSNSCIHGEWRNGLDQKQLATEPKAEL